MSTRPRGSALIAVAALLGALAGCRPLSGRPELPPEPAQESGAVTTVSEEAMEHRQVSRVEDLLLGVPGLEVIPTGNGTFSLRIRGLQSFLGSSEPLLVIDGMPVSEGGLSSALVSINPNDIKRIQVLKDAGSTSFYGVRGGNGVILITTKRGP
jgi:iron complex outermembrane receptor protein